LRFSFYKDYDSVNINLAGKGTSYLDIKRLNKFYEVLKTLPDLEIEGKEG